MDNSFGVTGLLAAASPIAGAAIDAISSVGGGLFSANQARKNRQFQERMYYQQLEDNRENWRMQNEYNLPSAQLQRLKDAGLNPLLMYGQGGVSNVVSSPASGASAPHGAQASANFGTNFGQALVQAALMKAQIQNISADTKQKVANANKMETETAGQVIQNEINQATKDLQIAKAKKDNDLIDQSIEWLATQDNCLENMTAANIANLASVVDFREKYYNLDSARVENQIWYNIESIALGKAQVSLGLKQLAVDWYNAVSQRKEVMGKLMVFREQVASIAADTELTEQEKTNKILDAYNTVLKNEMIENIGTSDLGSVGGLLLMLSGNLSGRIKD